MQPEQAMKQGSGLGERVDIRKRQERVRSLAGKMRVVLRGTEALADTDDGMVRTVNGFIRQDEAVMAKVHDLQGYAHTLTQGSFEVTCEDIYNSALGVEMSYASKVIAVREIADEKPAQSALAEEFSTLSRSPEVATTYGSGDIFAASQSLESLRRMVISAEVFFRRGEYGRAARFSGHAIRQNVLFIDAIHLAERTLKLDGLNDVSDRLTNLFVSRRVQTVLERAHYVQQGIEMKLEELSQAPIKAR